MNTMRHLILMAFLKKTDMGKVPALAGSAHHDQDIRAANLTHVERVVKMVLENNGLCRLRHRASKEQT